MADTQFQDQGQTQSSQGGIFGGSTNPMDITSDINIDFNMDLENHEEKSPIEDLPSVENKADIIESFPIIEPVEVKIPEAPKQVAPVVAPVTAPVQPVVVPQVAPQVAAPVVPQVQKPTPAPVQKPVQTPVQPVAPKQVTPVVQAKPVTAPQVVAPVAPVAPVADTRSDAKKKFDQLLETIDKIHELKKSNKEEAISLVGANNDKTSIVYDIILEAGYDSILITKTETDKEEEEETINELKFVFDDEGDGLDILLDDVLLYQESDFANDQKKKLQVMDKMNKFIFLASEELKKAEKEIKEKEEEENEKRRLQDIFRNF